MFGKSFKSSAKFFNYSNSKYMLQSSKKWIIGCGTLGLTFGLMYNNISKRKIYCKEDPNLEGNHYESVKNFTNSATQTLPKPKVNYPRNLLSLNEAIDKCRLLVDRKKSISGLPGLVVGVSIDGEQVWAEGFGLADLENQVPCHKDTVMRIASISKSITMAAAAKLWEDGKLNLDKDIQDYLPDYPTPKLPNLDTILTITSRQLASHLSGIRHYEKSISKDKKKSDSTMKEFYSNVHYDNIKDALKIFQNDPLLHSPGEKFLYTTHGYTLFSAVIESVAKEPFHIHMQKLFRDLGMRNTYLDKNDVLIYNRSKYYYKKNNIIMNSPYVDNSFKWAGGGFLSTVGDLLKFGNIMLYSYQQPEAGSHLPGYLKSSTVKKLWEPVTKTNSEEVMYGLGWSVVTQKQEYGMCNLRKHYASHAGGAVGASSFLMIVPRVVRDENSNKVKLDCKEGRLPNGIVVAIITNLEDVGFKNLAEEIAQVFDNVV